MIAKKKKGKDDERILDMKRNRRRWEKRRDDKK
jgi:hypothetical protein